MVLGKSKRWSLWANSLTMVMMKKRYLVKMRVARLEGLPPHETSGSVLAVGIRWKGPPGMGGISGIVRRRAKKEWRFTREMPMKAGGVVEWPAVAMKEGFEKVCCFAYGNSSDKNCFGPWEVCFSILRGFQDEVGMKKKKKFVEIATTKVDLAEWICTSKSEKQGKAGNEYHLEEQCRRIPITLTLAKDYSATLCVNVRFVEVTTEDENEGTRDNRTGQWSKQDEESSNGPVTDDSGTFDSDIPDLEQLLQWADELDKVATYKRRSRDTTTSSSRSSSGGTSPEVEERPASKSRSTLPWKKKKKNANKSNDNLEGGTYEEVVMGEAMMTQVISQISPTTTPSSPNKVDTVGRWKNKEFLSRDMKTKLNAQVFFASIDQRDESAGGESACTALVVAIANALHSNGGNMPTRSEFEALIREGSSEWQKLCDDASYMARFPGKHFDLETILEARIRPLSVSPEKSFVGFFQPESFESLRGAMSFEDIWDQISSDARKVHTNKVYIVSWNDHFFLLKVEAEAYYIMDTLGERLYEGCNKAYILRFDDSTRMHGVVENDGESKDKDEVIICSGKECCREFIKRFLAAIPLREELEIQEKGKGEGSKVHHHQRLQIEFHHTEAN